MLKTSSDRQSLLKDETASVSSVGAQVGNENSPVQWIESGQWPVAIGQWPVGTTHDYDTKDFISGSAPENSARLSASA